MYVYNFCVCLQLNSYVALTSTHHYLELQGEISLEIMGPANVTTPPTTLMKVCTFTTPDMAFRFEKFAIDHRQYLVHQIIFPILLL